MKNDLYTKVILTIIAICLVNISLKNIQIFPEVKANNQGMGLVPINKDGSITVRLSNENLLNVNIAEISSRDELDINIDEIGGMWVRSGGPIKVEVDD